MEEEEFGHWERANHFCHYLIFLNGEVENGLNWIKKNFFNIFEMG